jgi:hypothetical protein
MDLLFNGKHRLKYLHKVPGILHNESQVLKLVIL